MKKIKFLVSAVLLGYLARRTDWSQVADAFSHLRPGWWLAAAVLYAGTQLVSAWRWQLLARPLGFDRPLRQFAGFYFIGMFFNLVLPTSIGGDVVRAWYLDDRPGRRVDAFWSVFVDRASGLLVLLALACAAALFCPIDLPAWIYASVAATATATAMGVVIVLSWRAGGVSPRRRGAVIGGFLRGLTPPARLETVYLRRPALLLGTTLLSLIIQAANILIVWLVSRAIDVPVPGAYFWIVVPMVNLLTLLPISLNGMGLREAGLVLFLQPLGVPTGAALSLAFLWFLVFAAVSLLGGIVYLFGRFPRPEVQTDHGPVRGNSDQRRAGQYCAAA